MQAIDERPMPADLDEARRWITTLQDAYGRESAYVKRLERELHRQREVVSIAEYWHRARGWHRTVWLRRLKDVVAQMLETPSDL